MFIITNTITITIIIIIMYYYYYSYQYYYYYYYYYYDDGVIREAASAILSLSCLFDGSHDGVMIVWCCYELSYMYIYIYI